ncbi:hypothetical protein WOLCODRAFT_98796, partial [Wolfiporia cocos MD-104 SS10]
MPSLCTIDARSTPRSQHAPSTPTVLRSISMSGPAITTISGQIHQQTAYQYCVAMSSALIFYDYFLTLHQEIKLVWSFKINIVVVIFHFNRYVSLLWALFNMLQILQWTTIASCASMYVVGEVLFLMLYIAWAAFSALRVYAISGRNRVYATAVAVLALVPFFGDTATFTEFVFNVWNEPPIHDLCYVTYRVSYGTMTKATIVERLCLVTSDAIVLFAIVFFTRGVVKTTSTAVSGNPGVVRFRQDGIQYFIVLLILNILDIVMFATNVYYNTVASFICPISSIVISRCLLDLRQVHQTPVDNEASAIILASHTQNSQPTASPIS